MSYGIPAGCLNGNILQVRHTNAMHPSLSYMRANLTCYDYTINDWYNPSGTGWWVTFGSFGCAGLWWNEESATFLSYDTNQVQLREHFVIEGNLKAWMEK
jgi:hypothetical protein